MEALSDELRLDKYDYINLSTVYPTYLSTRQDLMEVISKTEYVLYKIAYFKCLIKSI